jgi:hypothetical protein
MNRRQRTLDEAQWQAMEQAVKDAPHGYKRKAEKRLSDWVHETMARDCKARTERKAA